MLRGDTLMPQEGPSNHPGSPTACCIDHSAKPREEQGSLQSQPALSADLQITLPRDITMQKSREGTGCCSPSMPSAHFP